MNAGDAPSRADEVRTHDITPVEIEARLRWSRKQGYVAWFWSDVAIDTWRACLLEIERVSTLLLCNAPSPLAGAARAVEIPQLCLPGGADARALGIAAFTSGMGPLLGYWIECGRLHASSDVMSLLAHHLGHSRRRADRMRVATDAALDTLAAIGLRPILVKAAHTSRTLFEEPGLRPAADIDLVVESSRFQEAETALARAGYHLVKREHDPRKSDWAPPGSPATLRSLDLTHEENPFTLEIHASLDREFYGVRILRFGSSANLGVIAAPELHPQARTLAQPLLTAYLAAHASEELHQLQLVRLVELALLLRRDAEAGILDWSALDTLITDRAAHRFTYPAFSLVERLAPGTIDPWFLTRIERLVSGRMKTVLARMSPATAQRLDGLSLDERFLWAESSLDVARRILYLLRPPRDGRSIARHWTDRLTRLLRGRVSIRRDGSGVGSGPLER
jgi:hypothetical protein